jgi:serine/threonine-protein kinase
MLAGVVPFDAETPLAIAAKHLHEPPPPLRRVNAGVPNAVEGITLKCMQKDPMARYLSMSALLQDIQNVRDALRNDQPPNWSPLKPQEPAPLPEKPKARPPRRAQPEERDYVDSGPSSRLLIGVALMAVLMVAVFFGAMTLLMRPPSQVTVPTGLLQMSEATAVSMVRRSGLEPEVRRDFSEQVKEGLVFDTEPRPGTELRAGKTVVLYVSRGGQPVKVPDVVDETREAALRTLRAAGLVAGSTREEFNDVIEKGKVISQTPMGGNETAKGSPIDLLISKGPAPMTPPPPIDDGSTDTDTDTTTTPPDDPGTQDLTIRDHEVTVKLPPQNQGPQRVRIVVRNADGSEETPYDEEHQPGETVKQTVQTVGPKGKSRIRVYVNDQLAQDVAL